MTNEYNCKRCGHEWVSRQDGKPLTCPRCKSYSWEVLPTKKTQGDRGTGETPSPHSHSTSKWNKPWMNTSDKAFMEDKK